MERGDTFKPSNSYVTAKGFTWKECADICAGGGPLMVGETRSLLERGSQPLHQRALVALLVTLLL